MLVKACPDQTTEGRALWKEAHELNLIFITIIKRSKETEAKKQNKE